MTSLQKLSMSIFFAAPLLHILIVGNALPPALEMSKSRLTKWVVITTINHPKQAIKTLAEIIEWRVVVVADEKTPEQWHLDNVDILDIEKQKTLGYKILPLLPYSHYGWASWARPPILLMPQNCKHHHSEHRIPGLWPVRKVASFTC